MILNSNLATTLDFLVMDISIHTIYGAIVFVIQVGKARKLFKGIGSLKIFLLNLEKVDASFSE